MVFKEDLYKKIILFVGDVEYEKNYFPIRELKIEGYPEKEICDYVSRMIEGNTIQGIFADDGISERYGYLIGGLNQEAKYLYHQLKKINE